MVQKIINSYSDMFQKYADFNSETSAPECVHALIGDFVVSTLLGVFAFLADIRWAYFLLSLIPTLAISIRTLKTCGKSWAWILLNLLPYGELLFIIFMILTNQDEKFF